MIFAYYAFVKQYYSACQALPFVNSATNSRFLLHEYASSNKQSFTFTIFIGQALAARTARSNEFPCTFVDVTCFVVSQKRCSLCLS